MKRSFSVIFILLAFIITIGCFSGSYKTKAYADNDTFDLNSKSAILIDANTKTVIYNKNENEKLPIASMCKIMTLLLCFEAKDNGLISFDETITISDNAAGMGGSQVFLEENGEYKITELIKSITVASANDACVAMAERISGNENAFVELMNKRAKELGMDNTVFTNCTGLPKVGQFSCAKDVSIMFSELIKYPEYFRYSRIWTDVVMHPNDRKTEISNTNKLIRFYQGCDSGKTGYTSESGHCLAASAIRGDLRLISVVISAPDSKSRFKDTSSMFNYGFANYCNKKVVDDKTPLSIEVKVDGGKKENLEVVAEKPFFILASKNDKRSFEIEFEPTNKIIAPINKGDVVGILNVYENNKHLATINVISNENVLAKTYFDRIADISQNWAI